MNNDFPVDADEADTPPCSPALLDALRALQSQWSVIGAGTYNPFDNMGDSARYDVGAFQVAAYSWSDSSQDYNLKWRDVKVRWYKYLGRSMEVSRQVTDEAVRELFNECSLAMIQFFETKDKPNGVPS